LQEAKAIIAYAYVIGEDEEYTLVQKMFYVKDRPKPEGYAYTPEELQTWNALDRRITALEEQSLSEEAVAEAVDKYFEANPVEHPVTSVNGQTGAVALSAKSVGAISQDDLQKATDDALAIAKASGEFDGEPGAKGDKGDKGDTGSQGPQGIQGEKGQDGITPEKGVDYFTDEDKNELKADIKAEVPLIKTAEQPIFVNDISKCTDTSKIYLLPDGHLYAYGKTIGPTSTKLTADDMVVCNVGIDGAVLVMGVESPSRIATYVMLPLENNTISINCPSPYQYFVYYFSNNTENIKGASSASCPGYIGKTSWKSGGISDVMNDTLGSGTKDGAKYCRISFRDSTNTSANLTGRIDEFMSNVSVEQIVRGQETDGWLDTGFTYNQPSDYEDRVVAMEKELEVLINGTF
jgi:hypothetical protein